MLVKGSFEVRHLEIRYGHEYRTDNAAAQAQVSVVENRKLTRGDGSLRSGEIHPDPVIGHTLNRTVLINRSGQSGH